MNDFERDDKMQREVRDSVLAPGFYGTYAYDGRYVFMDKGRLATILQKRFAVDTIVQGKSGRAVAIEEKIVRWPGYRYRCYALETESCTKPGHESVGWMSYGQADYLLYCFILAVGSDLPNQLELHLIDFQKLKHWFFAGCGDMHFEPFGPLHTLNGTQGRKVPIESVKAHVGVHVRTLFPDPSDPLCAKHFPGILQGALV